MQKKDLKQSESEDKRLILASASPRRREILESLGLKFEVRSVDINESEVSCEDPEALVKELAKRKCDAAFRGDGVVIGADTVVYMGGKIFGKPGNAERAEEMLKELSGRLHTVYTGVHVRYGAKRIAFVEKSKVRFKKMSEEQIRSYVAEYKPFDKAGAYGVQDKQVVKRYAGSYTNIVGLPAEKLVRALRRAGVLQ